MTTNPNNAIGTNAAFAGRTSVNAFNDVMGALSRGVLSGWACVPNTGLTVSLGGNGTTRDVAIAEDNAGNRTSINNRTGSPVDITLGAAPVSNSRIDLIVAYVDNPANGTSTSVDNPAACGLISVEGTAAGSPTPPDDNAIRTAITADGASGVTAYYVVLAQITITSGQTTITSGDITAGAQAGIGTNNVQDGSITLPKLASSALAVDKLYEGVAATASTDYTMQDWTGYRFLILIGCAFDPDNGNLPFQKVTMIIPTAMLGLPLSNYSNDFFVGNYRYSANYFTVETRIVDHTTFRIKNIHLGAWNKAGIYQIWGVK